MEIFDASQAWGAKHITALEHPMSEFNARGGLDLGVYQSLNQHLAAEHPHLGEQDWLKIKQQLPAFDIMHDPRTGQKIRIQKFNWPKGGIVSDQVVTFINMSFSVPADLDNIQYENYLVAKELGAPFVVLENPAYGDSDKLTKAQKVALKNGDFGPIADSMLGIANTLGVRKVNFTGYSMGAETAAAMAAHATSHGIEVENLWVMEAPRITTHKPLKLARDFMSDANNLKFTWKHPADPVLREVGKIKPSLPKSTFSYGKAMTKGGLATDLIAALDSQPNMKLTLASAGSSKISPTAANNTVFTELRSAYPDRSIRRIIVPGESHTYGDSGQRYAHLGKLVLR